MCLFKSFFFFTFHLGSASRSRFNALAKPVLCLRERERAIFHLLFVKECMEENNHPHHLRHHHHQDHNFPERKGQKRKLEVEDEIIEEEEEAERGGSGGGVGGEISGPPSGDARQALLCEVAAQVTVLNSSFSWREPDRSAAKREVATQVTVLNSSFSWREPDRSAAKRATHVLAELAKNGNFPPDLTLSDLLQE